jgi:membrane protease YdiL (CAAX protease family)
MTAVEFQWFFLAVSLTLWINLIWRWKQFGWPLPFRLRRSVPWHPIEAVMIIVIVLFVVAAALQQFFVTQPIKSGAPLDPDFSLRQIQVQCLSQVIGLLLIPALLSLWHLCYWADFGLARRDWTADLQAGCWGVLLSILPVRLLEWPIQSLRVDSPHPLFELLRSSSDNRVILAWVAFQVIVLAPLIEELLFRVILQGALSRESTPSVAIILTSAAFVGIHQPVDWAPLLPLALILGYVYYRRQSYLAVVALHGIFNGLNLILALATFPTPEPSL